MIGKDKIISIFVLVSILSVQNCVSLGENDEEEDDVIEDSFYNFAVRDPRGEDFDLHDLKGKVSLFIG